jgi:hypothetical protein
MDYKQKYLKYKIKYLKLKGGNECDFTNGFLEIARGQDGIIYKKDNFIYKVINIIPDKLKGVWAKGHPLIGGSGMTNSLFLKTFANYKLASDHKLGPTIHGHYLCGNKGVIKMDFIDGQTIKQAIEEGRDKDSLERLKDELIKKLEQLEIIPIGPLADTHNENFMIDKNGKIYGIDF